MEFHKYLIDAEDSRKVGDYDIKESISKDEAIKQITRAEKFLEVAQNVIGSIPDPLKG